MIDSIKQPPKLRQSGLAFLWSEKANICSAALPAFQTAVTCLLWPSDTGIVYGLVEGKVRPWSVGGRTASLLALCLPQVRLANTHTNKSSSIYTSESCLISLASK